MSVKNPAMNSGMYLPREIDADKFNKLLEIRRCESIPNLEGLIFDFPVEWLEKSDETGKGILRLMFEEQKSPSEYIAKLRPYQTTGVAFLYYSKRSIIGDGVGLGKTVEIAGLINLLRIRKEMTRFLMAVEKSAVSQTRYELMRLTGLNIIVLPGDTAKMERVIRKTDWSTVDGIIIGHGSLRSDALSRFIALNIGSDGKCTLFNTFILDESSVIKNKGTKVYDYTYNLCRISDRVHFMNATTFETSIIDFYTQLDILDDELLPSKATIERMYSVYKRGKAYWVRGSSGNAQQKYSWSRVGYKNTERFRESIKLVYFARCKADIGIQTPYVHKVFEVEATEAMRNEMKDNSRYPEILNCPSLVANMHTETNRETVPKIDKLCSLIENEFSEDKVMVYCFHIEAQEAIKKELEKIGRKPVTLNGSVKDDERYKVQQNFNNGVYDVIITNVKKSLNLYGGDVCIVYSMETNPSKLFQIAGRIDRNVDNKLKTYIMLVYKNTPEYEFFMNVVRQRAKNARELTIDAKTTADYFFESMEEDNDK